MQDCGVSSALAMEILQSYARLLAYTNASSLMRNQIFWKLLECIHMHPIDNK